MSSTFLKLCQDAARECSIAGTGPSTLLSQTGELGDIVRWMRNGYIELQLKKNGMLRFLRHGFTLATVADTQTYTYASCTDSTTAATITRFGRWFLTNIRNQPKCYLTATGASAEYWLTYLPYDEFQRLYQIGSQGSDQPAHITVDPQNNILLGPTPNDAYTVTGEYYRSPEEMDITSGTADTAEPELPERWRQMLVYLTMDKYAGKHSAPEIKVRIKDEYGPMLRSFLADQSPPMRKAGPLA